MQIALGRRLTRAVRCREYCQNKPESKLQSCDVPSIDSLTLSNFNSDTSRGNSKYHYYGIRLKPESPLNRLQEDTQYMAMRQQPIHQKQR